MIDNKHTSQDYWKSELSKYVTIGIVGLALITLLCCCRGADSTPSKHAIQPKYHKGQIVYVLGEVIGEVSEISRDGYKPNDLMSEFDKVFYIEEIFEFGQLRKWFEWCEKSDYYGWNYNEQVVPVEWIR